MSPPPVALLLAGSLAAASAQTAPSAHWSFAAPTLPEVPLSEAAEAHPIDAFVQRNLAKAGLARNPPAGPRTLARRIALDLTGLPPEPETVERFAKAYQRSPDTAVRQLIDRSLASPHYGERWAQHWLDVIRWAETV